VTTDLELVLRYDEHLEAEGRSPTTRTAHLRVVGMLARDCPPVLAVTTEAIADWLGARKLTKGSRAAYLARLRSFFAWAVRERLIDGDPTAPFTFRTETVYGFGDVNDMMREYRLAMHRRGLFPRTINVRLGAVRELHHWAGGRSVLDVGAEDVERMLDTQHLSSDTRSQKLGMIHAFYAWAIRHGYAESDPTVLIDRPRRRPGLPRPIADDDLAAALDAAPPLIGAWLCLGAFSGLRCQEIAGLRREDVIDARRPPVLVIRRGKGGRERVVPLHPTVLAALERYGMPGSGFLFPWHEGAGPPISPGALSKRANAYLRDRGIESKFHALRHYFATSVYQASLDLRLTQELLGHASPTTTAVYAAWDASKAADVIGRLEVPARPRSA
jgi:integrase/recombinase XerC